MSTKSSTNPTNSNPSSLPTQDSSTRDSPADDTPEENPRRLEGPPAMLLQRSCEPLLRVVIRTGLPSEEIQHEFYREVLRSKDGGTHFTCAHIAVDPDRNWAMDEIAKQGPCVTAKVNCGLEHALQSFENLIPSPWRLNPGTIEVLDCKPECRKAWQSITGEDDETSDGLFPEQLRFQADEA